MKLRENRQLNFEKGELELKGNAFKVIDVMLPKRALCRVIKLMSKPKPLFFKEEPRNESRVWGDMRQSVKGSER